MSETNSYSLLSESEAHTAAIAAQLAEHCQNLDCITLRGDLGTGKTVFSRALIRALCGDVTVQSPTFLLIKPYETKAAAPYPLYHMDLYRLEHEAELENIGFDEYIDGGLCLIEWPDIAKNHLPSDRLDISITHGSENQRKLVFSAKGDWQERLNNVHSALC